MKHMNRVHTGHMSVGIVTIVIGLTIMTNADTIPMYLLGALFIVAGTWLSDYALSCCV